MASIEQLISQPSRVLGTQSATAAVNTLQLAAPGARTKYYVTALCISASGAPAAAVAVTFSIDGQSVALQLPASAFAPIFINFANKPLESDFNEQPSLSVPSLGGGVISTVTLYGFKVAT